MARPGEKIGNIIGRPVLTNIKLENLERTLILDSQAKLYPIMKVVCRRLKAAFQAKSSFLARFVGFGFQC